MTSSLAERLRTETRALHIAAERSRFMRVLLRGEMSRAAYAALLRNLHAVYAALEPALARHVAHPQLAPITLPGLARTKSLENDLVHWHGADWREALSLQPAAESYVARLHELDETKPGWLTAHAYVRYLGDLSGGQMLKKIVARSLGGGDTDGTAFYDFGGAAETKALTESFREGLERLTCDADEADALVAEAKGSFVLHQRLFDELARAAGLGAPDTGAKAR